MLICHIATITFLSLGKYISKKTPPNSPHTSLFTTSSENPKKSEWKKHLIHVCILHEYGIDCVTKFVFLYSINDF